MPLYFIMKKNISVVVPTFNSSRTLINTIQACLQQDYPKGELEVIVVDDGSTDDTKEKVGDLPVVYLYQRNSGPAAARNTGWRQARGEIIFFTDADCIPQEGWVSKLLRHYDSPYVGAAGGSYGIANPQSLLADCVYQEIVSRHLHMPGSVRALGSFNLSVRREILEKIGGFNTDYKMASGEDNDLSYKILKEGYRLIFDKEARVSHFHPERLGRYLKSQFWHGYWRVKLYLSYPGMIKGDDYSNLFDYLQPVTAVLILMLLPFSFSYLYRRVVFFLLTLEFILQLPILISVLKRTRHIRHILLFIITFLRAFSRGLGMSWAALKWIITRKI